MENANNLEPVRVVVWSNDVLVEDFYTSTMAMGMAMVGYYSSNLGKIKAEITRFGKTLYISDAALGDAI